MLNRIANLHKICFPTKPWNATDFADLKKSGCEIVASENGFIVWRTAADETEIITIGVHPDYRGTGIADALLKVMEKELYKKLSPSSPPVEGSAKPGVVRDFISDSLNHPAPSGHPSTGGELKIFLEVAADNIAAQKLYERNGYKKIATRKNYYDGKIDAIIMQKIIS